MSVKKRIAAIASCGLLAVGLAVAPALSASAYWDVRGYNNCAGQSGQPTTMTTSVGYTYHEIGHFAGASWAEDNGSGALKFHSLSPGVSATYAEMEYYNETYVAWTCAGSGYAYTGW